MKKLIIGLLFVLYLPSILNAQNLATPIPSNTISEISLLEIPEENYSENLIDEIIKLLFPSLTIITDEIVSQIDGMAEYPIDYFDESAPTENTIYTFDDI